jgi:hypothetical protein
VNGDAVYPIAERLHAKGVPFAFLTAWDGEIDARYCVWHGRRSVNRDSYRRTRTIAETQSQGYTHLWATCAGCGRITDIPWRMLLGRPRVTPESFIGNLPLRCQVCGDTAPIIGPADRTHNDGA